MKPEELEVSEGTDERFVEAEFGKRGQATRLSKTTGRPAAQRRDLVRDNRPRVIMGQFQGEESRSAGALARRFTRPVQS